MTTSRHCWTFELIGMYVLIYIHSVSCNNCKEDSAWIYYEEKEVCFLVTAEPLTLEAGIGDSFQGPCDYIYAHEGSTIRLVSVVDEPMFDFLVKEVLKPFIAQIWIGAQLIPGTEVYRMTNGENATFFRWAEGYPLSGETDSCVFIDKGAYYNTTCGSEHFALCESIVKPDNTSVGKNNTSVDTITTPIPIVCDDGYEAVERQCQDINECDIANGDCHQDCVNTPGSFICACRSGYLLRGDGKKCADINECESDNGGCQQECVNTPGSWRCQCISGYQLLSGDKNCADIDECLIGDENGGCDHACVNTLGDRKCECKSGFIVVNGTKCIFGDFLTVTTSTNLGVIILVCLSPLVLILLACLPCMVERKKKKKKRLTRKSDASTVDLRAGSYYASTNSSASDDDRGYGKHVVESMRSSYKASGPEQADDRKEEHDAVEGHAEVEAGLEEHEV